MSQVHEQVSQRFYQWELRGRGWQVFDRPVYHEPPLLPLGGHSLPDTALVDDGRKPTLLSSLIRRLSQNLSTQPPASPVIPEEEIEPEPESLVRESMVELQTCLPASLNIPKEAFEQFLHNVSLCREPLAFELLGLPQKIIAQFATHPEDASLVRRQLQAHFPEVVFQSTEGTLEQSWEASDGDDMLTVEFGLEHEFMLPLATGKLDPFVGIVGALAELQSNELALFQVLFQPAQQAWSENILRSVTHADGQPFFINAPELAEAAKNKLARPLYAAVVRILVRSERQERTLQIARDLAASLRVFAHPHGNALIPLSNDDYPFEDHIEDALRRQSRRTGMLLNSDELIGFVHLPSSAVRSSKLQRQQTKTKMAPPSVLSSTGLLLGVNHHDGRRMEVRMNAEHRVRHTHIVGATGTGKSTLMFNLIRQDIESGQGLAVLDPHGELIEKILTIVPANRVDDVVFLDPSDEEFFVSFNILSAHSDFEKNLLASDLVSVFRRLCATWGDQMGSVLNNAIMAFLESSQGGTLSDLRRFLLEPEFRNRFLETVRDPNVVYYWRKGFPQLGGNKSIGPVLTRLDTFLSPKPIRYMVSQAANKLDFANILDSGKILLVKLPQGQLGRENAFLLGSLVMAKLQQLAMSRQRMDAAQRRDFFIYLDEFQNFISPSIAEILAAGRKYRVGLVLAHQELHQLQKDTDVASAVLSNPHTRIVFRVGDADARFLEKGFAAFDAQDFQNLEIGQAIGRIERSDGDFNLSVAWPKEPDAEVATREQVVAASRKKYATSRAEVEAGFLQAAPIEEPAKTKRKSGATPPPPAAEPKAAPIVVEVPKEPVVETNEVSVEPISEIIRTPAAPRDLGRGGEQHRTIQERLQSEAHALGFLAEVESQLTKQSNHAADLVLQRGPICLAVEITITTTTDHEFGNVKKCLAAGFTRVAMVSPKPESLQAIAQAVQAGLGPEASAQVSYHTPDELIAELRKLAAEPVEAAKPALPKERVTRGFKVRRHGPELSEAERKSKQEIAVKMMAQTIKPKG